MKGREEVTMDGRARFKWVLTPSHDTEPTCPQRVSAGASEQTGTLHARLVAATVETLAEGSNPRLVDTRDTSEAA